MANETLGKQHYTTHNCWVHGHCPTSDVLESKKYAFRKLNFFPSSGKGREAHSPLVPLEGANLNH
jgi:hypothetical protein